MRYLPGGRMSICGPFWPPLRRKRLAVLEGVVVLDAPSEDAAGLERLAVDRLDQADLGLFDDQHLVLDDLVEEWGQEVQAGLKNLRLDADFARHSDDAAFGQRLAEVTPLHDADLLAADVDQHPAAEKKKEKKEKKGGGYDAHDDDHSRILSTWEFVFTLLAAHIIHPDNVKPECPSRQASQAVSKGA